MPDRLDRHPMPYDWHDALDALPDETPPPGGWEAVAARLDARRRPRWPLWTAAAAAVLLAVAVPWHLHTPPVAPEAAVDPAPPLVSHPSDDVFEALYAESAQLEALLPLMRDERMASGTAAALASELDARLTLIDTALRQPGLDRERRLALWHERVDALRDLTGFESTRRWLAANGGHYDPILVRID